uniref:RING-type E3 ubiquitin transferase n=1 Tax=Oryza brachyantha TaxID=4533 RepID=J3MH06_ORYBR
MAPPLEAVDDVEDGDGDEEDESDDDEQVVERRPVRPEYYDSDDGLSRQMYDESGDEDDEPVKVRDGEPAERAEMPLVPGPFVPEGRSVCPARFAAVGATPGLSRGAPAAGPPAGFMRVAVVEGDDDPAGGQQEIVVLYRYTRYSRTWSGSRGVEMSRRMKLHHVRFIVSPTADLASSLPMAGSSLAPMIYPFFFKQELRELWSTLVAPVNIPPGATRLQVSVEVGILRPFDRTPERMEYMRRELETKKAAAWPGHHFGLELSLPEPVLSERDIGDAAPPAKRMRVVAGVAGEECPICLDELEADLVAWPGCSVPHVFHGECLELNLENSVTCPICRRDLGMKNL